MMTTTTVIIVATILSVFGSVVLIGLVIASLFAWRMKRRRNKEVRSLRWTAANDIETFEIRARVPSLFVDTDVELYPSWKSYTKPEYPSSAFHAVDADDGGGYDTLLHDRSSPSPPPHPPSLPKSSSESTHLSETLTILPLPVALRSDSIHIEPKRSRLMNVIDKYDASLPDELSVCVGDTVRILKEYPDEWCFVELNGVVAGESRGFVPRICLAERGLGQRLTHFKWYSK